MSASGEIVLRIGDAIAVLMETAERDRHGRDRAATAALRRLTRRADIAIERRQSGRPRLAPPYPELAVSLARRGHLLLVGFAPVGSVGVDIEPVSAGNVPDPARLARDHLAPAEATAVCALGNDAARLLFLTLWTAKEAALKLSGRGVFDGMRLPDLSAELPALGGADIITTALPGLGAVLVRVCRAETAHGPHLCALAVSAASGA